MQKKVSECVLKFKERSVPYGIFLFAFAVLFLLVTMHPRNQGSAAENQGKASAGNASAAGNEAVTAADKSGNAVMDGISAEKSGKVAVDGTSAENETVAAAETPKGTENISVDAEEIRSEDMEETVSRDTSPYEDIAISIAEEYVTIYQKPDTSSKVLGKLYGGSSAKVLRSEDGWVKLRSGKVTGYAKTGYLVMGADAESVSEVSGQYIATVKKGQKKTPVYEGAEKDSEVLKKVKSGSKWRVTGENGAWTEIQLEDGSTGFIASERVEKKMQFQKAISIAEEKKQKAKAKKLQEEALLLAKQRRESILAGRTFASAYAGPDDSLGSSSGAGTYAGGTSEGSALQRAIVSYALQFVGNPYVWGGESLTNGCDCSGFVMKVYEKYGYSLPHYSGSQAKCGTPVSLTDLEPGDLVFYLHGGRIGHVAMYIGNGKIVHAKSKKAGIVVTSVNYAVPYSAVRLV